MQLFISSPIALLPQTTSLLHALPQLRVFQEKLTAEERLAGQRLLLRRKQYWLELQFLSIPEKTCLQITNFYRTFFL